MQVNAVAFLKDGLLATAAGKLVAFWDVNAYTMKQTLTHEGTVNGMMINTEGTLLATCGLSAALMIWVNDVALFSSASFVVVYAVFSLFFGGAWPVMYVVTPASFPTSMRGVGFGLASASGKVGTLLGPLIIGAVLAPDIIRIGTFLTVLWAAAALSLVVAWRNQNRAAMRP